MPSYCKEIMDIGGGRRRGKRSRYQQRPPEPSYKRQKSTTVRITTIGSDGEEEEELQEDHGCGAGEDEIEDVFSTYGSDDDDDDDEHSWEASLLSDDEDEERSLGKPQNRSECYGCRIAGENNMASVTSEGITKVLRHLGESIGKVNNKSLAVETEAMFESEVRRKANKNIEPGKEPVPEWKAATILAHSRDHHTDPELDSHNDIADIKKYMSLIRRNGLVQRHKTKRVRGGKPLKRVNPENMKMYIELCKLKYSIYSKKPEKMQFYNAGSHIIRNERNSNAWMPFTRNIHSMFRRA